LQKLRLLIPDSWYRRR